MEKLLHKLKENRIIVDYIYIFIISIIISLPLLAQNIDIYLDDGIQHVMRSYGSYKSIIQNGTSNVIFDFVNGFGYSWDLFYGPLSSYILIILGIIFNSFNIGFKMLFFLIMFFSGIFMYKFVDEMVQNKNSALLAGAIYILSPYFFTDIYVRHAIGECLAFVFVPLVFLGLYNLFNTEKNHYYLIFGAVGLILTHNISTIITVIFASIYCIINIKNIFSTRVKKGLIINIIFIVLLTSFYWLPFLQTKYFTNYRVFEKDAMATKESVIAYTLSLKDLFITPNNTIFVLEIGLPILLMLVFSVVAFKNLEENKKEYLFFLISRNCKYNINNKIFSMENITI